MRSRIRCWALCLLLGPACGARAQEPAAVIVVSDAGEASPRSRAWRRRVERALGATTTLERWSERRAPPGTAPRSALAVLSEIEALLVSARASAARLEERRALRELAQAEALARANLALPGISAWYAEVQLAIAVTAAQAGEAALADAALRRAASVDPSRLVAAAEARPDVVERSRAIVQAAVTGPRGRFEVRASAPGARVFVDDRPLGPLPRVVEVPVGPHVLRVEAPGHRSWAQLVEVLEGERAPVTVRLSPTAERAAALRIEHAAREGRVRAVGEELRALGAASPPEVWMLWAGAGAHDRAVAVRCAAGGCDGPRRLEASSAGAGLASEPSGDLVDALVWMDAPRTAVAAHEAWWERWYVWTIAGALLAGAITGIAVAAQPQGQGPLRITLDPSMLPRRTSGP